MPENTVAKQTDSTTFLKTMLSTQVGLHYFQTPYGKSNVVSDIIFKSIVEPMNCAALVSAMLLTQVFLQYFQILCCKK